MDYQAVLIVALVILTGILSLMLVSRIRNERRQMAVMKGMNLSDFSRFLLSNSAGGTIGEVARKVSTLLEESCGCDRVLFLRKRRGWLELNYQHGLGHPDRRAYRVVAGTKLSKVLEADFLPRPIAALQGVLPDRYFRTISKSKVDLFFPVFWRDNLYGVYFVRSTIHTDSRSFNVLVASMAQSLSAAYHVKWHESRIERMQKRLDEVNPPDAISAVNPPVAAPSSLLKLVLHRNAETIIPKLIHSIREDLNINRIAFLYRRNGKKNSHPLLVQGGLSRALLAPDQDCLDNLLKVVDKATMPVGQLADEQTPMGVWASSLREAGLESIASFSLTPDCPGVLAWSGGSPQVSLKDKLQVARTSAADLMDNAESFERIEEMSYTDGLTGLANQRYFRRRLDEEIQRAKRYDRKLAFIIFDLDGLKATNDTYGHLAGDAVLKQMGGILRRSIRAIDIIARYGGDEFCIIMPETDATTCLKFMERLKGDVAGTSFVIPGTDERLGCTVSLGGAVYPDHADVPKQLIHFADMALLEAKSSGRNKSVLFDEAV
ncbi:MAG: GGDEF domain-containing protein [candidate division Zixibacteria bacterium]|nr:GGDEF domain-containing protein [candidate division Zixibacteria bacterium]